MGQFTACACILNLWTERHTPCKTSSSVCKLTTHPFVSNNNKISNQSSLQFVYLNLPVAHCLVITALQRTNLNLRTSVQEIICNFQKQSPNDLLLATHFYDLEKVEA